MDDDDELERKNENKWTESLKCLTGSIFAMAGLKKSWNNGSSFSWEDTTDSGELAGVAWDKGGGEGGGSLEVWNKSAGFHICNVVRSLACLLDK